MGSGGMKPGPGTRWLPFPILLCLAFALLASCGGGQASLPDRGSLAPVHDDGSFNLPPPSALKTVSYTPAGLRCCGADYLAAPGVPLQNADGSGECCTFTPDWTPANPTPGGLAYACYAFDLEGYDRPHVISFSWDQAGASGDCWVGLADLARDCWTWHPLPADNALATDLTPYIDAGTGQLLVLALFTGSAPWELNRIKVGDLVAMSGRVLEDDGETPLYGAEVVANGAEMYFTTVDYDGNWSFAGLPPGSYSVGAYLIGWDITPYSREAVLDSDDVVVEDFTGTLLPAHTVSGYVYENPGDWGLPGVEMQFIPLFGAGGGVSAWTDFDGFWTIDLPDGSFTVEPSLTGWTFTPDKRNFTVSGADTTVPDFLGEQLAGYTIDGYVYCDDGVTPLPDIQINVTNELLEIFYYASTDSDGYWSVTGTLEGDYTVEPMWPGYVFEPPSREITVAGADVRVDPFLGTELGQFTVDGYVYLDDGVTPLAGVSLELTGVSGWFWADTDSLGHYIFESIYAGNDYHVVPQDNRYSFEPQEYAFDLTGDLTLDPFLATELPTFAVDGYIYETDGVTPVEDVYVQVYPYMGSTSFEAYTDTGGHWLISAVPPGFYGVLPQKQGWTFEPQDQSLEVTDHDVTVDDFLGSAQPFYVMDGYVYELDGTTPVPGVTIFAYGLMYNFETTTDTDGHWVIDEAFEDTYEVTPSLAPWEFTPPSRTVEVSGGDITVDDFLGEELEAWLVDGYIYEDGTNTPVPDVQLQCYNGEILYYCTTEGDGHYEILLPNGDWEVYPVPGCWTFTPNWQDITVDGAPITLDVFYATPGG